MLFGGGAGVRLLPWGSGSAHLQRQTHTPPHFLSPESGEGLLTGHAPITGEEETETQGGWETEARPHAGPLGTPGTK